MRFGLFGTGPWAHMAHAPALAAHESAELVGVWGRNPDKAADTSWRHTVHDPADTGGVQPRPASGRDPARGPVPAPAMAAPAWLAEAERAWQDPRPTAVRTVIPIWRDTWMVVGSHTFTGDLAARLGLQNLYSSSAHR